MCKMKIYDFLNYFELIEISKNTEEITKEE